MQIKLSKLPKKKDDLDYVWKNKNRQKTTPRLKQLSVISYQLPVIKYHSYQLSGRKRTRPPLVHCSLFTVSPLGSKF
ncbi:hypothetical protein DP113_18490 [Brasilonema octagenarum UFV-E1]|uniref:Uncharacterized protein n=2 Tax=Brasilonema TaxID=383614 RepID=A0A856MFZ1_9CYAN|nr:hypothetical protein [Brasilonema octagenarum UFV-OR1]QDL09628.1 hypothetical protein DP114_18555 [Brasilonema sennae CENA114]QDL15984.1 hypothetical protein DP113_18490 [Brasilonema octagenarum UFV-E1]